MKISEIDDKNLKQIISKSILSYYEENHAIIYDSVRQEIQIIGLMSRPDYLMVRDALIAMGANGCDNWENKICVRKDQGGKKLAENIKAVGLRFTGESSIIRGGKD